eukprot:1063074-Rhodomonas_salina.1
MLLRVWRTRPYGRSGTDSVYAATRFSLKTATPNTAGAAKAVEYFQVRSPLSATRTCYHYGQQACQYWAAGVPVLRGPTPAVVVLSVITVLDCLSQYCSPPNGTAVCTGSGAWRLRRRRR